MDHLKVYALKKQFKTDDRGWAFFPFQAGLDRSPGIRLESLHVVCVNPGETRGNHFHPGTAEWMHAFGSRYSLYWEESGQIKSTVVENDHHLVYIPQGVAHAIKNTGSGPLYVMAFQEVEFPGDHSQPKKLV